MYCSLSLRRHLSKCRYSHFSNDGLCQLFRTQDYLPPEKRGTHDVRAPDNQELLENVLMSKCPRCEQVSTVVMMGYLQVSQVSTDWE